MQKNQLRLVKSKEWYKKWWIWIIIIIILVLLGSLLPKSSFAPPTKQNNSSEDTTASSIEVPDVTGQQADTAYKDLRSRGFKVEIKSDDGRDVIVKSNWTVKSQSLNAGDTVNSGTFIVLVVTKPSPEPDPAPESNGNTPEQPGTPTRYVISENTAEKYCQDAALIGRYINLNDINIIWATNYGKYFDDKAGGYDESGNPIAFLRWNGKYKKSGAQIMFSCWISGSSNDNITLHWLSINGTDYVGSAAFGSYNESGTKLD
ncbi:PASTA domain-containing protein [Candidatus Saccharibacteria bacterium]|nr:PASTA domain-containing protein [Candidatus Saccharibacteria bacterium]